MPWTSSDAIAGIPRRGLQAITRLVASTPLRLALLAFVVYNLNLRSITSYDTYPARLLPISILTKGSLDLDEFTFLREPRFVASREDTAAYFMSYRRDHWMSVFPVMPAVLAAPVYAGPVLLGLHRGPPIVAGLSRVEVVATLLSKLAASLAAAASVVFMYLTLRHVARPRAAVALALIYAFATSTWSVTSQGLWGNAFSQPAFARALLAFVRAREANAARWVAVAGFALAVSVACRPPMLVVAVVLSIYVLRRHAPHLLQFAIAPIVIGALVVPYDVYYFGALIGGYSATLAGPHRLSFPVLSVGLRGLLISPNRGLFVFSPILIPSFAGMWLVLTRRRAQRDTFLAFVAVATVLAILQYAAYVQWHAAFGFSYRYLSELLPAFVLLLAPVWEWLVATTTRRAAMTVVISYSVCVQVVGAFYYPCDWYRSPLRDPSLESRFFSWTEMELLQCLRAGPVDPDGLRAIRHLLGIPGGGRKASPGSG
jgi:hypothetical protein